MKIFILIALFCSNNSVYFQSLLTNTFTYQGELKFNNALANGSYDFEFSVFDVATGGSVLEIVTVNAVTVTNGVFTTPITLINDLFTGNKIWLDIGVRANGTADPFDPLSPRQEITSSPYAIHAQFVDLSTIPSWNMGGNAVANGDFIGTTNGQPLVMKVANEKVLRIDQATNSVTGFHAPHVVIGASSNSGGSLSIGGTTVTGGQSNRALVEFATVTGGIGNEASGFASIVTGGQFNNAAGYTSTVPGGNFNQAGSNYSFAAGNYATVRNPSEAGTGSGDRGTFVWSDSTANAFNKFTSTGPNQFLINANGGVGIGTNDPGGYQLNVLGSSYLRNILDTSTAVDLVLGGGDSNATDDGVLTTDLTQASSDLLIKSNGDVVIALDDNDDEVGLFQILDGLGATIMQISETGGTYFEVTGSGLSPPGFHIEQQGASGVGMLIRQTSTDANLVLTNKGTGDLIKAFTGSGGGNLMFRVANNGNVSADGGYISNGADFAEYLPTDETDLQVAEVVGLKKGKLSRDTSHVQRVMVISSNPAFVGNNDSKGNSGKALAAFMGQVHVKVKDTVQAGDWLVTSGQHDGYAQVVQLEKISPLDYQQIIGQALENSDGDKVLTLVGLPAHALMAKQQELISEQQSKLKSQQQQITKLQNQQQQILAQLQQTQDLKQQVAEIKLMLKQNSDTILLAQNKEVRDE